MHTTNCPHLNRESCGGGGSCQTSAATIPTTTPSATPLTPFVIAPLDPVDDGLTAVLAADFALERAEEADEATSEAFELAELTFEESDALRYDTEADADDLNDDRAALSVL